MRYLTLNELSAGESARIIKINEKCGCRFRLMDLGFTCDSDVSPVWIGAKKNITAYLIKGTIIALRSEDAGYINVIAD